MLRGVHSKGWAAACAAGLCAIATAQSLPPVTNATPQSSAVDAGSASSIAQSPTAAAIRRALLVGIDQYPREYHWPVLAGPRADVAALLDVLLTREGFSRQHVVTLLDAEATRAAILSNFERMIAESRQGDVILFYFAGHGSKLPDDDGDELDGWDETLVPYDAIIGPNQFNDIRDDKISELITLANRKTDQVVLIFDCCSAGTNTRAESIGTKRYLDPATRGLDAARPSLAPEAQAKLVPKVEGGSGYLRPAQKYVALSACRASESAFELQVPSERASDTQHTRGLFTWCLVQAFEELGPEVCYADLLARVASRVNREQHEQTPILEGRLAGYSLFQAVAPPRAPRFALAIDASGVLQLEAGKLQGLEPGAILGVCDGDAVRDTSLERLGRIELTEVGAGASRALWLESPREAQKSAHCAAFLLEHGPSDRQLGFAIDEGAHTEELARALEATHLLRRVSAVEARVTIGSRSLASESAPRIFGLRSNTGVELPVWADASSATQIAAFVLCLSKLARAAHTVELLRNDDASTLAIDCKLERVDDDGQVAGEIELDSAGVLQVEAGAPWSCRIVNRSAIPVFVTMVLELPDAAIELYEPPTIDDPVAPGQSVQKLLWMDRGRVVFRALLPTRRARASKRRVDGAFPTCPARRGMRCACCPVATCSRSRR